MFKYETVVAFEVYIEVQTFYKYQRLVARGSACFVGPVQGPAPKPGGGDPGEGDVEWLYIGMTKQALSGPFWTPTGVPQRGQYESIQLTQESNQIN